MGKQAATPVNAIAQNRSALFTFAGQRDQPRRSEGTARVQAIALGVNGT